jgi:hypothetical protein
VSKEVKDGQRPSTQNWTPVAHMLMFAKWTQNGKKQQKKTPVFVVFDRFF